MPLRRGRPRVQPRAGVRGQGGGGGQRRPAHLRAAVPLQRAAGGSAAAAGAAGAGGARGGAELEQRAVRDGAVGGVDGGRGGGAPLPRPPRLLPLLLPPGAALNSSPVTK